jgi:PAS domain S-box-containing protein
MANTERRPVSGFETGRVLSGFRYVFPIVVDGEHLGSMEASVSFRAIRDAMAELEGNREYAFLLHKGAVDGKLFAEQSSLYGPSALHQDYLVEDPNLKLPDSPPPLPPAIQSIDARLRGDPEVAQGMSAGRAMTVTTEHDARAWAATFLPVRDLENRQAAYVVAYAEAPLAALLWRDFLWSVGVSTLMLAVVALLILRLLRSQDALKSETQSLQAVTDTVADGLYAMDREGRLTLVNPAAEALLGFRERDVLGSIGHDLFHSHGINGKVPVRDCQIFQRVSRGEAFDGEELFARADGGTLPVEVASRAVLDRGRITGSVTVFRDITQRKKAEAALNDARAAAEAASRMKSEFLANMSHEIRTPMNGIIGLTQLALEGDLDPAQREYLELVGQSANTLLTIINDILDFSKIEAGRLHMETIPFAPGPTLEAAIRPLARQAAEKGLALNIAIDPDVPDHLEGDPVRLTQALTNLVGNAIKFTGRGRVDVAVARLPDLDGITLEFSVADTGTGIPADKLDSIFESFSQADASITRRFGGTGLGLAITRHLVRLMGGETRVESTPGKGSRFSFTARFSAAGAQAGAGVADRPATGEPALNVLLVEDNAVNRMLATALLGKAGHRVDVAEDGARALALLTAEHAYDVVLMDVQMPIMDGLEVTRAIRAHESAHGGHLPIIAMTANAMVGDRERCLAAGMDDYVAKPIRVGELFDALARVGESA